MIDFIGKLHPIGVVRSPHKVARDVPIQPLKARGVRGTVELDPRYTTALRDLEGFERIWLVCWFHRASSPELLVTPYMDDKTRGLFATRAPSRPNPIGISPVRLTGIRDNILDVEDVDILDGTPLLDIKPYVPHFDCFPDARYGWLERVDIEAAKGQADGRFFNGK